jgi:hypothetical protein
MFADPAGDCAFDGLATAPEQKNPVIKNIETLSA